MRPVPTDLRSPLQRANDQLAAARRELTATHPSRDRRRELADRIRTLTATVRDLMA
ncbi:MULTISPECIES: hypothetical protein [unclassified Streptomyces]|uniref:hypothetical protein n=1 Tax=unclassified Streptomyces TaxID=2593676 RepID=UPI0013EB6E9C|nr:MULTISPECIES: hypothetical protein [unclassified Streptomyces]